MSISSRSPAHRTNDSTAWRMASRANTSKYSCATASNAGERLGELQLQPGQSAHLAESSTQSGWDLRVENEDGSIDELLQLKATESMGYVKQALVNYPEIQVVVPSEIDARADDVLGTDISNERLDNIAQAQIGEMGESTVDDLLDQGAEAAFDSIPFASMIATGVIEGGRALTGTLDPPGVFPKRGETYGESGSIQRHRSGVGPYRGWCAGGDGDASC